ncbi:hypothetical protein BGZ76_011366 [Entomortierella beljakovae]|nr:hypothetical protein BGZ76_011366 [Entomortierella beljakovae]
MTSNSYARAIRASVLAVPPPVTRGGKESLRRNFSRHHQDQANYYGRSRNRQTMPNAECYQQFYEPGVYDNDPAIAIPTNAFARASSQRIGSQRRQRLQPNYSPISPHSIQHHHHHHHPLDHINTSFHPLERHGSVNQRGENAHMDQSDYNDPFRDVPIHRHPTSTHPHAHSRPHPQHPITTQRHTMHIATHQPSVPIANRRPSVVSEYRRPHSFAVGSTGDGMDEVPISFRTRVLDENDDQSDCTEVEAVTSQSGNQSKLINSGKLPGSLRQHFKRLSLPYVQAIRQQQQQQPHMSNKNTSNFVEDGNGDLGYSNGNGIEGHPIPGPAPIAERRWSRNLLKSVVGGGNNNKNHIPAAATAVGEGYIEEVCNDDVEAQITAIRQGHRQVHSGSLASFRGLDDPNHPRLRVMNPDDGVL